MKVMLSPDFSDHSSGCTHKLGLTRKNQALFHRGRFFYLPSVLILLYGQHHNGHSFFNYFYPNFTFHSFFPSIFIYLFLLLFSLSSMLLLLIIVLVNANFYSYKWSCWVWRIRKPQDYLDILALKFSSYMGKHPYCACNDTLYTMGFYYLGWYKLILSLYTCC